MLIFFLTSGYCEITHQGVVMIGTGLSALLKVVLYFATSVLVCKAQITIDLMTANVVDDGSTVELTCTFRNAVGGGVFSVDGGISHTSDLPVSAQLNVKRPLGTSEGFYILRNLTGRFLQFDINFTARALPSNGGELQLQCLDVSGGKVNKQSPIVAIAIRHGPFEPSVKDEEVPVNIRENSLSFQLNCSGLRTGNPAPDFRWTYDHGLTANITETGPQNSTLVVKLGSLEQVPELLTSGAFVCEASNVLGSVNKSFILNVSAIPSAPRQLTCNAMSQMCSVNCTWNEPVSPGSSNITQYTLTVSNGVQEEVLDSIKFQHGQTDYSIISASFAFYSPNNSKYVATVKAINDVGTGVGFSDTFYAPGPCMKPEGLSLGSEGVTQMVIFVNWTMSICPNENFPLSQYHVTVTNATSGQVYDHLVSSATTGLAIQVPQPNTTYTVVVVGINCFGESEPAMLTVKTLARGIPSEPMFEVESKAGGEIIVTWGGAMSGSEDAKIVGYIIYYTCGSKGEMSISNILPEERRRTLTGLGYGVICSVDVVARNSNGQISPRNLPQKSVTTLKKPVATSANNVGPIVGGVVGGVVVVVAVLVVIGVLCWKHNQDNGSGKSAVPSSRVETGAKTNKQSGGSKPTNTQATAGEYARIGESSSASPNSSKTGTDGLQYAELDHLSSEKKGSSEARKKFEQTTYADIKHT